MRASRRQQLLAAQALKPTTRPTSRRTPLQTCISTPTRPYAVQSPGAPSIEVFSNHTKFLQKERAASNPQTSRQTDYLYDEIAARLCDRLLDINRTFPRALDFGSHACTIPRILTQPPRDPDSTKPSNPPISSRIGKIICTETSPTLLCRDAHEPFNSEIDIERHVLTHPENLPFPPESFDLAMSCMSLHWINDLPSVLSQIHSCLKPDAPFIAAMSGGETLFELRGSLQLAEQERLGGIGTHISPLADVRDVGNLLGRAGFKLLTVDVDDIVVDYPSVFALMADLQSMGEGNAALRRDAGAIGRDVLLAAEGIYRELYGEGDGLPATFRTIYMIGWKEGADTPKPLQRGTGEANLVDVLGGGGKLG